MIKILVVTHGPLAQGLKESSRMFFGDMVDDLSTLGLFPGDSPESLQEKIKNTINAIDQGDGVMVFVDIFAGSPFNMTALAIDELKEEHKIACFTGINMPLLMESLGCVANMSLDELTQHIEEVAGTTIVNLRKSLEI
ncbi:MAG: PTS sugar transporter subunit IIA [Floccifex sp.]